MSVRVVLLLALLFVGCGVRTPVRRAALVPRASLPANHGAPIGGAGIRAFANINSAQLTPSSTLDARDFFGGLNPEGTAGLWVPQFQFGGGFWGAFNEYISLGVQAQYTNLNFAERNVAGVLEFPEPHDDQSLFMGGVGARANIPVDKFTPAFILEVNSVSVPEAVFVCDNECELTTENPIPTYTFREIERETFFVPHFAFHLTYEAHEYFHLLGILGASRGIKNNGFDSDLTSLGDDSLEGYLYGYAGAGFEFRYDLFYASAVFFGAFGQPSEIGFGLSGSFTVGFVCKFDRGADQAKESTPTPVN